LINDVNQTERGSEKKTAMGSETVYTREYDGDLFTRRPYSKHDTTNRNE